MLSGLPLKQNPDFGCNMRNVESIVRGVWPILRTQSQDISASAASIVPPNLVKVQYWITGAAL